MDIREVCIPIKESERSTKSSVVSDSNSLQEGIEEDLRQTSPAANRWILHKVPYMIRQVNEKAYVPRIISIGPYHHDKEHLKATEVIKWRHFRRMIEETKVEPKKIVDAMQKEVKDVRNLYEGSLNHIDDDRFVRMLVLDGCFILQLFRETYRPQIEWIHPGDILCDLLLLENQLPFVVLLNLYSIIKNAGQQEIKRELYDLALGYFQGRVLEQKIPPCTGDINGYHDYHLLGLVHDSWLRLHEAEAEAEAKAKAKAKKKPLDKIVHSPCMRHASHLFKSKNNKIIKIFCWPFRNQKSRSDTEGKGSREFRSSATDLERTGINFDENKGGASLLDIEFAEDAKELKIPRLAIEDNTELIFRNLLAYEQFILHSDRPTLVCDYVSFMDKLIDSGKDVQLLREVGIIHNWLGDDEAVAKMFNHLGDFAYIPDYYYKKTVKKLKKHCRKRRYRWLATLKREYFNSPWSFISFLAAVVLLALTVAQTIFSVLSYVHQ